MMKNKQSIYFYLILVFFLGAITPIFFWNMGNSYILLIRPLIWLFLLLIIYLFLPKRNKPFNFRKIDIREYALIAGLIYVIVYYMLGIAIGYAKSPYDRSFVGIVKNLWMIFGFIVPREIIRNYFIKGSFKKNQNLILILITLIMVLTDVSYANFASMSNSLGGLIEFFIKTFLPLLGLNIFLTYLSTKDNFISSLIYIAIIKIVSVITPVFPNNIFFLLVLIDYLVPLFTFIRIEDLFSRYHRIGFSLESNNHYRIVRLVFIFGLILVLTFTTRLLPIMPTVIMSNSMNPQIKRGDMVIIKRKTDENIKINDIIEYKLDNIYVIHRIINIYNSKEGNIYITKGDNNQTKDSKPVKIGQITGKVVMVVPSVGYPTIWIRDFLENARGIKIEEGVR